VPMKPRQAICGFVRGWRWLFSADYRRHVRPAIVLPRVKLASFCNFDGCNMAAVKLDLTQHIVDVSHRPTPTRTHTLGKSRHVPFSSEIRQSCQAVSRSGLPASGSAHPALWHALTCNR
jgi:hypothetical protein